MQGLRKTKAPDLINAKIIIDNRYKRLLLKPSLLLNGIIKYPFLKESDRQKRGYLLFRLSNPLLASYGPQPTGFCAQQLAKPRHGSPACPAVAPTEGRFSNLALRHSGSGSVMTQLEKGNPKKIMSSKFGFSHALVKAFSGNIVGCRTNVKLGGSKR
ncbi:ATP synthase subunit beta [Striga asiatica]|uniref:ATP synthase subunit beta n=1 Tax=Striga asiatica TaxID=4170 RepID=A0A5A7QL81_STRAF|nr:ATP synthase subunit beta [Striga asiatica]